jgi:hypothetical protein
MFNPYHLLLNENLVFPYDYRIALILFTGLPALLGVLVVGLTSRNVFFLA